MWHLTATFLAFFVFVACLVPSALPVSGVQIVVWLPRSHDHNERYAFLARRSMGEADDVRHNFMP